MKLSTPKKGKIFIILILLICIIQILIIAVYTKSQGKQQIISSNINEKMAYGQETYNIRDSWGVYWNLIVEDDYVRQMTLDINSNSRTIDYVYIPAGNQYHISENKTIMTAWGDGAKAVIPSGITVVNLYIDPDIGRSDCVINGSVQNIIEEETYSNAYSFAGHSHSDGIPEDLPYYKISYINENKDDNCTQDSIKKYTCSVCNYTYTQILEEANDEHDYKWVNIGATCEERGYRIGVCTRCSEETTEYTTDEPLGHNYQLQEKIEPTCTEQGYEKHKCTRCGRNENRNYVNSLGHNYTSQITTPVTCVTDGVRTYTCSRCNNSYTETIAKTGHNYTSQITTPATCVTNGVITYTCSNCNNSYTEAIAAIGHNYTSQVTTEATAITNGIRTYTCSNCNDSYTEIIPALTATNIGINAEAVIDINTRNMYIYSTNNEIGTINKELLNAFIEKYGRATIKTITFNNEVYAPYDSSRLFSELTNLTAINNANNINTSKVTSIAGIFLRCYNLQSIDVSNWNTSKVTNMNKAFANCSKLEEINLSKWDMNLVEDVSEIFIECSALSNIYTSKTYSNEKIYLPSDKWYNVNNTSDNNIYSNYNNEIFSESVHLAKLIDYNINYNLNGGAANGNPSTYNFVSSFTLNNPTREGYTFKGWTGSNGENMQTTVSVLPRTLTGNLTYTANWESNESYSITSEKYDINLNNNYIMRVSPNTNVQTFINAIATNGNKKIVNAIGVEVAKNSLVGTGYKLQVDYKGTKYEYEIAVRGDLDGSGTVTITDLSMLNKIFVKKQTVTGVKGKAADLDYNGEITITDISKMNQYIIGKNEL